MEHTFIQKFSKQSIFKHWVVIVAALLVALVVPFAAVGQARAADDKEGYANDDSTLILTGPLSTCGGPSKPDKDDSAWGKYFKKNGVNIRKLPSTSSKSCGHGQKSHKVDYHCWVRASDGSTWTYLRDVKTNYEGWVRDDLLKNNGSHVHC